MRSTTDRLTKARMCSDTCSRTELRTSPSSLSSLRYCPRMAKRTRTQRLTPLGVTRTLIRRAARNRRPDTDPATRGQYWMHLQRSANGVVPPPLMFYWCGILQPSVSARSTSTFDTLLSFIEVERGIYWNSTTMSQSETPSISMIVPSSLKIDSCAARCMLLMAQMLLQTPEQALLAPHSHDDFISNVLGLC